MVVYIETHKTDIKQGSVCIYQDKMGVSLKLFLKQARMRKVLRKQIDTICTISQVKLELLLDQRICNTKCSGKCSMVVCSSLLKRESGWHRFKMIQVNWGRGELKSWCHKAGATWKDAIWDLSSLEHIFCTLRLNVWEGMSIFRHGLNRTVGTISLYHFLKFVLLFWMRR